MRRQKRRRRNNKVRAWKTKTMRGLQGEGRRTEEHLCGGKFGRWRKIEWDIHVQMLAHLRPLFSGLQ
jgi:hypothetical protein